LLIADQLGNSASPYVNFSACAKSVVRNLIEANPDYSFDVFIQSWVPDLAARLEVLYHPTATCHEDNGTYAGLLHALTLRSLLNEGISTIGQRNRGFWSLRERYKEAYAGLSSALALQKAVELLEQRSEAEDYDFIVLYRPDILLLERIDLNLYDKELVYCNKFSERLGDFRWIFAPKNRYCFKTLLDSIPRGNFHRLHYWIRDYFDGEFTHGSGAEYVSDEILAGRDEEVLRQVKLVGIAEERCKEYGVTAAEYARYC